MIRVLETNVDDQGYGGVYAFNLGMMNAIRKKNENIKFAICAFEPFEKKEHIESFTTEGIQVYNCWGGKTNFIFKQIRTCLKFWKLLRREKIDVIHIHSDVAYKLFLYGTVAVMSSNAKVIVHSHSTNIEGSHRVIKKYLQNICRHLLGFLPVTRLACSVVAAEWMYCNPYNKKAILIKNGIDTEKFRFNPEIRQIEREKLGLTDDNFLIGTVGRFSYPKNPEYLLRVFEVVYANHPNARLLWVGEGERKSYIVSEANKRGIANAIIFYGTSEHVERLYQAMDCFVLPSRFEGLGIVVIEAQASGLPCVVSDKVPSEVQLTGLVEFISLNDIKEWKIKIEKNMNSIRRDTKEKIVEAGYDVQSEVAKIQDLYCCR